MKIRALRVREVGALRDPVALEGLSGGLDVLSGPNELGKSTLLRALQAAFLADHKTARGDLKKQLVPYAGGAPTIEVDFELGGNRYRLRKRYFSGAKASLNGLDDGALARGADAEARLAELLATAGGKDRLGLLWVEQNRSLEAFDMDAGTAAGLKTLIERELTVATGSGKVHAVRERVRQRLEALVTDERQQPRDNYKAAIDAQARLSREHAELRQKVGQGRAGFDRLAALRESQGALASPAVKTQRLARIAAARLALETARAAADKRRAGEEAWKRLDQAGVAAATALVEFDRRSQEQLTFAAQKQQASAALAAARAHWAAAEAAHTATADGLGAHEQAERDLAAQLEQSRRDEAARALLAALRKRLAEASALAERATHLRQALAANRATPDLAYAAEAAGSAIETLEAKLTAASVRITVVYERGADGAITRDGATVPANMEQAFSEPVELVIAGVGRIRIAPNAESDQAETRAELARRRRELGDVLARSGAADVAGLRERAIRRGEAAVELDRASARLEGICPEGVQELRAEAERLTAGEMDSSVDTAAIETGLRAAQNRRKSADLQQKAALAATQKAEVALARLGAEAAALQQHHAALLAALPAPEAAAHHRKALEAAATEAGARAREAILTLAALREREPESEQMAALEAGLASAIAEDADIANTSNAQAREMAALEAELRRDALDGISERLEECAGELAAMDRQLAALSLEVAALMLLNEQFDRVEANTRAHYLGPVTDRLAPYLQNVLPGAALELGEGFGPQAMRRDGRSEPMGQLSHGTREQVAVLVRLGLAQLLADTGEPLPLILDDALVYADDDRIAASFAALRLAAEKHQVIVLTCRAKTFEALGGARLLLRPWEGFAE